MPRYAIIFDLDGTLLDTLEDLAEATNSALGRCGFPPHPIDDYRQFVGNGARELIRRALPPDRRSDAIIQRCHQEFLEIYARSWDTRTRPYPGIPELLDRLAEKRVKTAILSNKPHDLAVKTVETLLAPWHFEIVLGQRDDIPRKPDPAGALEIANRLDTPPSGFLFIGDSGVDMRTAIRAGMLPIGVRWGFRSPEELKRAGAFAVVTNPDELLRYFRQPL